MSKPILVTYASRAGSTVGIAEAIGQAMSDGGVQVDVCRMQDVADLAPYRAVVAGSAIRGGKWLPEAMQFIRTHQTTLVQRRFAAFLVCITLAMPSAEKYRQGVATWLGPVRTPVKPVSEGYFAGGLDLSKLPLIPDGLPMRVAVAFGVFPRGDRRDWNAIRAWGENLTLALGA